MEAARFPGDYDGIVAGSPAPAFVDAAALRLWLRTAAGSGSGQPALRPEALALANAEAMAQCDAADGAADLILEDPRRCSFDPGRLQCGSTSAARCLAPTEVVALRQIYGGPPAPSIPGPESTGFVLASEAPDTSGLAIGSERGWTFAAAAEPDPFTTEFFRRAVFAIDDWSWRSFDFEADIAIARETAGWLDVPAAELGSFRDRGSKLIVYQGWNDSSSPPEATIAWYQAAAAGIAGSGGDPAIGINEFARLFMAPGMAQCGGEAITQDLQLAVETWVERGIAPDRIATSIDVGLSSDQTRTLCPYPLLARNRGTGSSAGSGSAVCAN
jgi:feruloyl esterase